MSDWTTLAMAKKQVGIPLTECDRDDWLRMILSMAEGMCLQVLQDLTLNPTDFPAKQAEIISGHMYMQFAELWKFRGDDVNGDPPQSRIPGALSVQIERGLLQYRPPSLA